MFKTPLGKKLSIETPVAIMIAAIIALVLGNLGMLMLRYLARTRPFSNEENVFRYIQVGTACYVALAQGANDVANAIGPLAVIYFLVKTGSVGTRVGVPVFLLLFGGLGIACGILMAGKRVIETMGKKITTLTNTRGFSVEFSTATTVLAASKMGLPVSTTPRRGGRCPRGGHCPGNRSRQFSNRFRIIVYWILTVPAAALTSIMIFKILRLFV